ncbi:protein of unknown function [Georgfuchsia toluolica]|uniref:HTH cro/C1-type domain-containing protein n=2 Tax=Georgfuchsia toluolica TaxID=424218 RepID=A0A916J753_9PROT|nr:protein of unknown function [Georgfuchsia toluolica]
MIRFRIQELMADKQFAEGRTITVTEVAGATGISRVTLSRMLNQRGYVTGSDTIDALCEYFKCPIEKVAEYIPAPKMPEPPKKSVKDTKSAGTSQVKGERRTPSRSTKR